MAPKRTGPKGSRKEKRAAKEPTLDQRLAKAFANPVRAEILTLLNDQKGSAVDLVGRLRKKGIKASRNLVSYHMDVLLELDCIELVETERIRGATKMIYRGTMKLLFDKENWPQLTPEQQVALNAGGIAEAVELIQTAVEAGSLGKDHDTAIVNLKLSVDEQAWSDIINALTAAYERSEDAQGEACNRTSDPASRFPAAVTLLAYELPRGDSAA
jgi:DNA-binding transcriptional ArsR family regulator